MFRDSDSSFSDDSSLLSSDHEIFDGNEDDEYQISVILNTGQTPHLDTPPPTWYEEYQLNKQDRVPVRTTIRRDNRLSNSFLLPIIAVSNLRSLIPKIKNFAQDIHEREIGLGLLTEDKKKHIYEIEKLMKMEGLKYISTTRPSTKRGGGAAIVVDMEKFSLEELDVLIPHNLEIVWGIMRPKSNLSSGLKEIIAVSFYCPPQSTNKSKLLDHILMTVHMLLSKYPNAGLIIGADKNDLNITSLISGIPRVRQIVSLATHKDKILDIILTNLHQFYQIPTIAPL